MSKPINRRKFLQTVAPLIAAPAILSNRNLLAAPNEKSNLINPPLEVLYDTLGNATDGWGWAGQGGYVSVFSNSLGLNFNVITCFIGMLTSTKRLRGFESAVNALNFETETYMPPSYFLGRFYLGIWRTDVGTFYQNPLGGSLTLLHANLSDPNVGSASIPVGFIIDGNGNQSPKYVIGWDNLDVLLPANVPLQISLYAEGIQLGDAFGISGTFRSGPNMLRASSDTGNNNIGQPMAVRIKVSDVITAANCEISSRVVNQSGRGISRARLTLQNSQSGETVSVISNSFGYFQFTEQPAGNFYILSVNAKQYTFKQNTQTFQLFENITNLEFVGN